MVGGIQFVFKVNNVQNSGCFLLRGQTKYIVLIIIVFLISFHNIIKKVITFNALFGTSSQTTSIKYNRKRHQEQMLPFMIDDEMIRILNITTRRTSTAEEDNSNNNNNNDSDKALLFRNNYFFRAWFDGILEDNNDNNDDDDDKPAVSADSIESFHVLQTYIRQHSNYQLQHEWNDCQKQNEKNLRSNNNSSESSKVNNGSSSLSPSPSCEAIDNRKFIVGMWSCPIESGNRLHSFMNALLWSILTNRTLLARYDSVDTCVEYSNKKTQTTLEECTTNYRYSHPTYCNGVLHLSPWVPQFDSWNKTILQISPKQIIRAEINLNPQVQPDKITIPYDNPSNPRIIRTGYQYIPDYLQILRGGQDGNYDAESKKKTRHLSLPSNLERLNKLGEYGPYFIYGMMFESLFTMDLSLLPPPNQSLPKTNVLSVNDDDEHDDEQTSTYILHSRHTNPNGAMDEYTYPEEKCILSFEQATSNDKPCLFYLMSDRIETLQILESYINNKTHCVVSKVENRTTGNSFSVEHGPFAGRGYWEDVALASQARNGMISFHMFSRDLVRTSSALIREIIEFRRLLELGGRIVSAGVNTTTNSITIKTTFRQQIPQFLECRSPWNKEKNTGIEI